MIKHIVMWTFKDEALGRDKAGNVAEVKRQLDALPDIVPGMGLFEVVPAQPGLEASYDLCLYSKLPTWSRCAPTSGTRSTSRWGRSSTPCG